MLAMRKTILEIVPNAVEVISYGMPAFKVEGNVVAGLLSNKNHVGYYPFSGSILNLFSKDLSKYRTTKSALHVPIDKPLPKSLLSKLIKARISQCPAKQGKVDPKKYESKDSAWRKLGLAAPARRGLVDNGILKLSDLKRYSEAELAEVHGIGPNALAILMKTKEASKR
ncbi:MAG: hypothetical protein FGM47_06535 [Candidatus Nanopelagicaceae bacterium]|nr:hypothetical protein [Candidatus Nanopelagicaceae bacterium]